MNEILRKLLIQNNTDRYWSELIPLVQRIINFTYSRSINTIPAKLIYGEAIFNAPHAHLGLATLKHYPDREKLSEHISRLTINIRKIFEAVLDWKKKEEENHPREEITEIPFQTGDLVLIVQDHIYKSKHDPVNRGPYDILEINGDALTLCNPITGRRFNIHHKYCKKFIIPANDSNVINFLNNKYLTEGNFLVEGIIKHKGNLQTLTNLKKAK